MKVVIDTNVLISGIFWGGTPYKILELWENKKVKIFASKSMLNEYFKVLDIMDKEGSVAKKWQLSLLQNSTIVEDVNQVQLCRDPDDDKFINCALIVKASHIISGDQDLLTLGEISNVKIVNPAQFVALMEKQ